MIQINIYVNKLDNFYVYFQCDHTLVTVFSLALTRQCQSCNSIGSKLHTNKWKATNDMGELHRIAGESIFTFRLSSCAEDVSIYPSWIKHSLDCANFEAVTYENRKSSNSCGYWCEIGVFFPYHGNVWSSDANGCWLAIPRKGGWYFILQALRERRVTHSEKVRCLKYL